MIPAADRVAAAAFLTRPSFLTQFERPILGWGQAVALPDASMERDPRGECEFRRCRLAKSPGAFDELDALGVPKTGTPEPRGGPIATAGGLLFIGATIDARFRAMDARTGKELWVAKLADAAKATPITYQGRNGKQYVAILAGGGETRGADNPGGRLYVFTLP